MECSDLESRYDLILGMAWLDRHEPWIDWKSEAQGATCIASGGDLESHDFTSARKQMRLSREHCTDRANMLKVGMSELADTESVADASSGRGPRTIQR